MARNAHGLWAAISIGALFAVAALVLLRQRDRSAENPAPNDVVDASTDAPVAETAAPAAPACKSTATVNVKVSGSYTSDPRAADGGPWTGDCSRACLVVTSTDVALGSPRWSLLELSEPFFAMEFDGLDLCSAEEVSPSRARIVCLGKDARLERFDLRIEDGGRTLVVDGGDPDARRYSVSEKDSKEGVCLTLEARIAKRDLVPLQKAFMDDRPSERCSTSTAPRRKVQAMFGRTYLPGSEPQERGVAPYRRYCYDNTKMSLVLPPDAGPSVDLGILGDQCEGCNTERYDKPNGIEIVCNSGLTLSSRLVYQLGDHVYFADGFGIRRSPLPCGVTLHYRMSEFVKSLWP